ncbi:RcnB family protein [Phenylobacterium aquaticum]|uniref:RcnB family protein n=1 Tax=Phenylobacterium aquaticum TaxID=1763816 RepID=UPI001F5E1FC6|nr:RcnB family protein [Phenylobacterium aquaticum]MCI3131013.1 RcnB family protein [Phenylobacterium aquaticum]
MKKILLGAIALSLAAASVASAQPYGYGQYNQNQAGQGQDRHDAGERDHGDRRDGDRHDRDRDRQGYGRPGYDRSGDRGEHRGWGKDYGGGHHWRRGQRMGYNDWQGAQRVDYRRHHLRRPPQGYEWRESNGQYILGAVATGVILSILLNGH